MSNNYCFSFDHLSKSVSAFTTFLETFKQVGKEVHIHFFENIVSEKYLPLKLSWIMISSIFLVIAFGAQVPGLPFLSG